MKDLREWLAQVEAMGELETLKGVPWDMEMGVICEMVERERERPAIVFDEVPGYPPGFRILTNALGSRNRFSLTMGFPPGLKELEMVQEWRRRYKELKLLPPRQVEGGPVMENAFYGEGVDVLSFPVPKWHEHDGGRYIGTGDMVITKGTEGDWINVATYRMMVHDRNHVGIDMARSHHGHLHMDEWFARGEPMPVAIAIGMDPVLFLAASTEVPLGVCEYDYAGAIRGEPVEVMPGPITGLPIPAGAEIVLEGFIDPQERRPEGPFGEFPGYYGGGVRDLPVIRVEGLYYRNNPIILGTPPLKPPNARNHYRGALRSALTWDALEGVGVPDIAGVWCYEFGSTVTVVAVKQRYPGHAKQAARLAAQMPGAGHYAIVVDEDIDISDIDEVLWALCTRVDPDRDIENLKDCLASSLDPIIPPERKAFPTISRVIFDATRPYEWRDRFPEVVASSPALKQQVLARWGEVLARAGIC